MFDLTLSAAIVLSDEFNASAQPNVLLVSSDGVGFRLDGSTLGSQSDTLAELVAGGVNKGGIAEVVVPESSAVLEAVLVYACRSDVPAFKLDIPEDEFWLVTSAMAKYEVRVGLAEVSTAFRRHEVAVAKKLDLLVEYYLFAYNFHTQDLNHAVSLILKPGYTWEQMHPHFRVPREYEVSDHGKLHALLTRRTDALAAARATHLTLAISRLWQTSRSPHYALATLGEVLELWVGAASCTSLDSLAVYQAEQERQLVGDGIELATHKLPWAELREIIRDLPDGLD